MVRKKVNLQWITKASKRRATFRRRRDSIKKKVDELATLCGTKVGVVLYSEDQAKPLAWPNDSEAKDIFKKFIDMPDLGKRFKKMQNQEELLSTRIPKLQHQISRLERENYTHEISFLLYESIDGRRPGLINNTEKERTSLGEMVEEKIKKIKERIRQLQGVALEAPLPLQLGSSPNQPLAPCTFNEMAVVGRVPPQQQQDWVASLTTNGGELGTIVSGAFASSSGGVDMMHPYNMDYFSRFP
ncbi:hypothetical protein BDA96_03G144000 [Sorghum bicolor]|jgi:hypothetical protein|uniref:MADS-box domain-containing protein n=1 Tax=Sorghum bicolor TaxID=4558 RepID=A0A921RCS7_SORBI|nr:hypothetical protein BDA96_03G144000 [Sorghum bicolor]